MADLTYESTREGSAYKSAISLLEVLLYNCLFPVARCSFGKPAVIVPSKCGGTLMGEISATATMTVADGRWQTGLENLLSPCSFYEIFHRNNPKKCTNATVKFGDG